MMDFNMRRGDHISWLEEGRRREEQGSIREERGSIREEEGSIREGGREGGVLGGRGVGCREAEVVRVARWRARRS